MAATYDSVLRSVEELPAPDQLRLLSELADRIRKRVEVPEERVSILELEGLGKEIWEGIDAQEYVNRERDSWDG